LLWSFVAWLSKPRGSVVNAAPPERSKPAPPPTKEELVALIEKEHAEGLAASALIQDPDLQERSRAGVELTYRRKLKEALMSLLIFLLCAALCFGMAFVRPSVDHRLICGRTGSGKTNFVLWELLKIVERGDKWIIAVFPHAQPGEQFVAELYARFGKTILRRLIVERLSDMDRVIMRDFIKCSTAKDPYVRMTKNDEFSSHFMGMAANGRQFTEGWLAHPVLEKYTKLSVRLCQNQDQWISQSLLPGSLVPKSAIANHYIDHCPVPELRMEFLRMIAMSLRDQLTLLEPAKRLLEQFLTSPPIIAHTSKPATFNRAQFLSNAGIFVILGGDISDDALRLLVGADFQETCFLAKKGRLTLPGCIVLDECNNYRLAGLAEAKALATMRAFGVNIWLVCQALDFDD
jgi:hypothetical protein